MANKAFTGLSSQSDASSDVDSIRFVVEQAINAMATTTLVLVKAVDAGAGTVDVQPMVRQIDGAGNGIDHGTIHSLPFVTLRAGASAVRAIPKVGDIGVALFCHNDISKVKATKALALPGSRRRYSWSDGVYLGGILGPSATQFIDIDDAAGITIQSASGKPVTINAPGGLKVTGDVTVTGQITASGDVTGNGTSLHTHKHSGVTAGSAQTGAPV